MGKLLVSCGLLCLCNCVSTELVTAMNQQVQSHQQLSQDQKVELFKAIEQNDIRRVRDIIVQFHADVNLRDENGSTLIMKAFQSASLNTVTLLRELGAKTSYDVDGLEPLTDNDGNTTAYYAVLGGYKAFKFGHNGGQEQSEGYFPCGIKCCKNGDIANPV